MVGSSESLSDTAAVSQTDRAVNAAGLEPLVKCSDRHRLTLELACFSSCHSQSNRIERCWGMLENQRNGALLDSIETARHWACTTTGRGVQPLVQLLDRVHDTAICSSKSAFRPIARRLMRSAKLPKWSLVIHPQLPGNHSPRTAKKPRSMSGDRHDLQLYGGQAGV